MYDAQPPGHTLIQRRVYLLDYTRTPHQWIEALDNNPFLKLCKEELLRVPWHVQVHGERRCLRDPCTLDPYKLWDDDHKLQHHRLPKIFVRPVETYMALLQVLRDDSTRWYRTQLRNRHIFVSEDMFTVVKQIEQELPKEVRKKGKGKDKLPVAKGTEKVTVGRLAGEITVAARLTAPVAWSKYYDDFPKW